MARTKPASFAGIGPAVRRARLASGMTQAQLADLAGIATETLSRIETGRLLNVTTGLCARLADALGVPIEQLLRKVSEPKRSGLRASERALLALVSRLDEASVSDLVRALRLLMGVARRNPAPATKRDRDHKRGGVSS